MVFKPPGKSQIASFNQSIKVENDNANENLNQNDFFDDIWEQPPIAKPTAQNGLLLNINFSAQNTSFYFEDD